MQEICHTGYIVDNHMLCPQLFCKSTLKRFGGDARYVGVCCLRVDRSAHVGSPVDYTSSANEGL